MLPYYSSNKISILGIECQDHTARKSEEREGLFYVKLRENEFLLLKKIKWKVVVKRVEKLFATNCKQIASQLFVNIS